MDRGRCIEVACLEGSRDGAEVRADRRHSRGVVAIALQLDATTVHQIIESVYRRVLVHPHDSPPSRLHGAEGRIVRSGGMRVAIVRLRDDA